MKNKLFLIILVLFTFNVSNIQAQRFLSVISYSTALPLGNTSDFINSFSWRGFTVEGRTFTQDNLSFGILFGWNFLDEKTDETIQIENGAVSGIQIRYMDAIPIMATAHYYFGKRRKKSLRPFMGINAGAFVINQRMDIGIWSLRSNNWHFGFAPEVGVLVPLGTSSIAFSVKYNYAFASGNSFYSDDNSQSFINFNIGYGIGY